jgi:peptidoglycan hydrolase CwlO-like protein
MKKIVVMMIASFVMAATVPAYAQMTKEEKDQCLLASKNCAAEVDSLQKKIKKLQAEIKKGKKVYSADDLKKLNDKLKEAEDMVDKMLAF